MAFLSGFGPLISSLAYFLLQKYNLVQFGPVVDAVMTAVGLGSGAALYAMTAPKDKK